MFVILLPRASKDKALFYFLGDSHASNPRQGHRVTIVLLPPHKSFRAISSRTLWQSGESHKLCQTVKQTRK